MHSSPLAVPRSLRRDEKRGLTSFKAGFVAPLAVFPLLREDAVRRGDLAVMVEMKETAELLLNAVYAKVQVHLVPFLAFPRFNGSMDILNRSYMGEPPLEGEAVIPFIETVVKGAHEAEEILKVLGLHARPGDNINTAYIEAYNLIWNYRAKNRSPNITPRELDDDTLAPGFWSHQNFAHIVPDFDQAVIDGEVALNIVEQNLALSANEAKVLGIAGSNANVYTGSAGGTLQSDGSAPSTSDWLTDFVDNVSGERIIVQGNNTTKVPNIRADLTGIVAELAEGGVTVSLSNIELARKTQAYARLRERYAQHDEEFVIDMLMSGLSIPDQALKNPLLLAEQTVGFAQSLRYATDSGALDESATNGGARAAMTIRVPRLACGGLIYVTAEVSPEALFERQKDIFLYSEDVSGWPDFLSDDLDPEKVEVVTNDYVDLDHATPTETFGYAPLNHAWHRTMYNIGGKFYRPESDGATDTDRQRLWAAETADPVLSEDFYLTTNLHQKPFLDTTADAFEAVTLASLAIEGNTVFGGQLVEVTDVSNYEKVLAKAPQERIDKSV